MASFFHNHKKLKGFTLIEMLIVIIVGFLIFFSMLDLTVKQYQFYHKILQIESADLELQRLKLQIESKLLQASSFRIVKGNHEIVFLAHGSSGKIYLSKGHLWIQQGRKARKFPAAQLLNGADFVVMNGYVWGKLRSGKNEAYFDVQEP